MTTEYGCATPERKLPTRDETIAWLMANFESRLRMANDEYQFRLLSRYEVEAVRSALAAAVTPNAQAEPPPPAVGSSES